MRLLVTGNCGFIGQNFCRMFASSYDIVGVDKLGYASDRRAAEVVPTFIADIADRPLMERIFDMVRPDAVVNFAAESHVDRSIQNADPFTRSNIVGTQVLLEMSVAYSVNRFLQVSTDEVYGDLQPDDPPFSDVHLMKPSSPYSASKAAADMMVMAWSRTHGLDSVITRTCNNYGPYQYPEKLVPVAIRRVMEARPVPVYGEGGNVREWIYVEDNCRAIEAALNHPRSGSSPAIFNIGTGDEMRNLDLVRKILFVMQANEDMIEFVADRKGHDLRYALDSEPARRILGWKPLVGLLSGLQSAVRWYRENPDYWEET